MPPFDVFNTLHVPYMAPGSPQVKRKIIEIFDEFRKSKVIGNKKFVGEFKLGRICRLEIN